MERSRKIFIRISSASSKVITTANEYADRKGMCGVQRSHFQLEAELRRISVACECIANILAKSTPNGPAFDVRLQDWLDTDEPQECLDTLIRMESLLRRDASSWMPRIFGVGRGTPPPKDKIKEAAEHFGSRKGYFHFLFSTEIWNNEKIVQQQQDLLQHVQRESHVLEQRLSVAVRKEINTVLDTTVHHDGHVDHITQKGSNVLDQSLLVPPQIDLNTISDMAIHQGGHSVEQMRQGTMPDRQQKEEEGKQLEEILEWLDGWNCAAKQDDTLSFRQPDTCKWLFDTAQYKMWRDGEGSFLWLRGKPGAGKSVIASSVIDSLETSRREGEILAFFYCDFRNERSTSSAEVMRSILSQLLRQLRGSAVNSGSLIKELIKTKERGGSTLRNAKKLASFASRAAGLSSKKPLVIVDALDECKDVRALLQALMVLKSHVRLFATSRPLHIIMGDLSGLPFISMDDDMADKLSVDIELHVIRELDARHRLRDLDVGFKNEIRSVLCEKAGGMFRWVRCSIDTLDRCLSRKEVRSALNSLPEGLDETYERILLAIDTKGQEGQLARRALVWLVAALRPLRLNELMEALSINLETRTLDRDLGPMHTGTMLDACGSLVTYTEKTGIIILSHFSVKEYLMGEFILTKLPHYHIAREHADLQLARSCICYISIWLKHAQGSSSCNNTVVNASSGSHVPSKVGNPSSQTLRDYALDKVLIHVLRISPQFELVLRDIKALEADIARHARTWNNIRLSTERDLYKTSSSWPPSQHDLTYYIFARFAHLPDVRAFLRRIALDPKRGTNPLVYAAHFGNKECARILLSRDRLNCRGCETDGFFQVLPIEVALRRRDYPMIILFLEEGSPVPPHIFTDSFFDPKQPKIPSSIARMLLQTNAFAEAANDPLNKPVSRPVNIFECLLEDGAGEQDLVSIIRRFVQVVDDHFAYNSDGEATLLFAIGRGHISVARYLLTLGASLPSDLFITLNGWTEWTTLPVIHFLVENEANVLVHTSKGCSALHIVLRRCYGESDALEAAKLLVAHGCDPLEPDSHGDTPLTVAVARGFVSVARYLLSLGTPLPPNVLVDMMLSDWNTWDDVQSMPRLLVENGADVRAHSTDGCPLLLLALGYLGIERRRDDAREIAEWLVSRGCDPKERNPHGLTAFHFAVEKELVSVAQYLLSLGVPVCPDLLPLALNPDALDDPDDPISLERTGDTVSMVRLLVDNGADVRAHTETGDSMLNIALEAHAHHAYYLEIAKLLVSLGCDPFEADAYGETPLHKAFKSGYISVARYFISVGVPLSPDKLYTLDPWKGLNNARKIRFLVENGLDAIALTTAGNSTLHIALKSGHWEDEEVLETVKFLIGRGCDPQVANSRGKTPLHIAVKHGQFSAARYLLSLGGPLSPDLLLAVLSSKWSWHTTDTLVTSLIQNGANVHARTTTGNSVLHILLLSHHGEGNILETAKLLVGHGCDPLGVNSRGKTPLYIAATRGHLSVARYLLSLGTRALFPDLLLLAMNLLARKTGHRKAFIFCSLVENEVDILAHTSSGDSLLHIALQSFDDSDEMLGVAKFLVGNGCDPLEANSCGNTPIRIAVERGHVSVARYLLSHGAPLPSNALYVALRMRRQALSMIKFLINHRASVLTKTSDGDSLLHVAAGALSVDGDNHDHDHNGNKDTHDDEVHDNEDRANGEENTRSNEGATDNEDEDAAANETLEIIQFLVQCGCDPATSNIHGKTPLHIAVERGRISIAKYLLSLNVPRPSDILFTAIQSNFLSRRKALDIVKTLVTSGCDTQSRNSAGLTLLDVATTNGHVAVVDFLLSVVELEPPGVQGAKLCVPDSRRARSESPDLPPAKRVRYS